MLRFVTTPTLEMAVEIQGDGPPVLLLHGWPDGPRTWDGVVERLVAAGRKTIVPTLRGFGATRFHSPSTTRSGEYVAIAQDAIDLLDALKVDRVTLVGHDWGAATAYILGACFPDRFDEMVVMSVGYERMGRRASELSQEQLHRYFYQWLWQTDRGREVLDLHRRRFCRDLWAHWSPNWRFDDAEFDATAGAWANPDWVDVTLHSYRARWRNAAPDPAYARLTARMAEHPPIRVPTTMLHGAEDGTSLPESSEGQEASFVAGYRREVVPVVGHFIQRERPEVIVDAVLADAPRA